MRKSGTFYIDSEFFGIEIIKSALNFFFYLEMRKFDTSSSDFPFSTEK